MFPFGRSSSRRAAAPFDSLRRSLCISRKHLLSLRERLHLLRRRRPVSDGAPKEYLNAAAAQQNQSSDSGACTPCTHGQDRARSPRHSDFLWTARPSAWYLYEGQTFSSIRMLLEILMRHAQKFRYRFIIESLDVHGIEISCCSIRCGPAKSQVDPKCRFILLLKRSASVFLVTRWQPHHSCAASYRARQFASHDFFTDTILARVLGADDARTASLSSSMESIRDIVRDAKAREPKIQSILSEEERPSFDMPHASLTFVDQGTAIADMVRDAEAPSFDKPQTPPAFSDQGTGKYEAVNEAAARKPKTRSILTAEELFSFDNPHTPPAFSDQGIRKSRASIIHEMNSQSGSNSMSPSAWRHARGEHGSLETLRLSRELKFMNPRLSSPSHDLRANFRK